MVYRDHRDSTATDSQLIIFLCDKLNECTIPGRHILPRLKSVLYCTSCNAFCDNCFYCTVIKQLHYHILLRWFHSARITALDVIMCTFRKLYFNAIKRCFGCSSRRSPFSPLVCFAREYNTVFSLSAPVRR